VVTAYPGKLYKQSLARGLELLGTTLGYIVQINGARFYGIQKAVLSFFCFLNLSV